MKLHAPFAISARLAPAVKIADRHKTAWLSFVDGKFILDLPDGQEHKIKGFRPAPGSDLPAQFASILGFMSACGESYRYAMSKPLPIEEAILDTECGDLFPLNVAEFCYRMSDEISMLESEIEDSESALIEA